MPTTAPVRAACPAVSPEDTISADTEPLYETDPVTEPPVAVVPVMGADAANRPVTAPDVLVLPDAVPR